MKKFDARTLVVLAMLAAISAVLKALISVDLFFGGMKISDLSLMALPVLLAGIYFGPIAGGMVGFFAEFGGYFLSPAGGYNPVFSIIAAVMGVMAGLFYLKTKKVTLWKTVALVVFTEVLCSGVLTTLTVHFFYGVPIIALLPTRGIGVLIKIPLLIATVMLLAERLKPLVRRRGSVPGTV